MRNPIEDFFGWDPTYCFYYPRFVLNYDVWREAISRHYCQDKKWLVEAIRETAMLAQKREKTTVITNWSLLISICDELIQKI